MAKEISANTIALSKDEAGNEPGCCPQLLKDDHCDVIQYKRILIYPVTTTIQNKPVQVDTEIVLHFTFKRCTLGLTLGDPIYTTTLLPGEKVKLATTDRRSRFTFDSETKLSYRSEQMSEDQYYMTAAQHYLTDGANSQSGNVTNSDSGDWNFHGDVQGSYSTYLIGGSADASTNANGKHNSKSVTDYLHEQRSHAESSATQSVNATRRAHSVSVGEVSTKTHVQGESEDHFESSSRTFENANHCHAVTYLFYQLNKKQKVSLTLDAIVRRVKDPAAPVRRPQRVPTPKTAIAVVPQDVVATSKVFANRETVLASVGGGAGTPTAAFNTAFAFQPDVLGNSGTQPMDAVTRIAILTELDKQLKTDKLISNDGQVSADIKEQIEFEYEFALPTGGVIVKGCLDDCDTCEPLLKERLQLENDLLRKQIDLLDKTQEYRCCPPAPVIND